MKQPLSPLAAEVEACVVKIIAYQQSAGQRVGARIKRSRKGREGLDTLRQFGLPLPDDFTALYDHFNGVPSNAPLSFWEAAVFLDAMWPEASMLVAWNEITRLEQQPGADAKIAAFRTTHGVSYDLVPTMAQHGNVPLVANLGSLSRQTFIAFDSTLAMLRTVCAAHDAGLIRYATDRIPHYAPFGREVEKNEAIFDPTDLLDVVHCFNQRADYWSLFAKGPVEWNVIVTKRPPGGRVHLDPAVRAVVLGHPKLKQ